MNLTRYAFCSLVATFATAAPIATLSAATGWLHWRGPEQTGVSRETGLPVTVGESNLLWTADYPGQSTPVIADGRVYVNGYLGEGADLQEGIIRMVSSSNLREDPLRLLRAYRQAAQLGFRVEPETRVALKTLAPLLADIAAERVQTELNYLLRTVGGAPWLRAAWQDGLLEHWLPHSTEAGLTQVETFEQLLAELGDRWPALAPALNQEVSFSNAQSSKKELVPSHRTWLAIAKLTCLLAPEADAAEAELLRLKMSRAEVRAALLFQQFLPTLKAGLPTRRDRFFFFQAVGPAFAALAMLASRGSTGWLTVMASSPVSCRPFADQ